MSEILIYVSSFLIIFSYISYFIIILWGKRYVVSKDNGFDVSKEMISEYNNINIILNKSYVSIYNIKRRVIKLSDYCYYGSSLSTICLSLFEAGVSIVDNYKNKYINFFRNIISNLKILYLLPMVCLLINSCSYTIGDVRIGIVFIILFSFVSYILIDIRSLVNAWVNDNISKVKSVDKDNSLRIISFINKILWLDKFILFGELIIIIRFIGILLELF